MHWYSMLFTNSTEITYNRIFSALEFFKNRFNWCVSNWDVMKGWWKDIVYFINSVVWDVLMGMIIRWYCSIVWNQNDWNMRVMQRCLQIWVKNGWGISALNKFCDGGDCLLILEIIVTIIWHKHNKQGLFYIKEWVDCI